MRKVKIRLPNVQLNLWNKLFVVVVLFIYIYII